MGIDRQGLQGCEQRIISVDMPPASLDKGDFLVLEIGQGFLQKILAGDKIGVEDGDELPSGFLQTGG